MATTQEIKERIAAFARELAVDLGDVDDSDALSWLDAIETRRGRDRRRDVCGTREADLGRPFHR